MAGGEAGASADATTTGAAGLSDLPLFCGPHVPRIRCERALERLDVRAALVDAPDAWRPALADLAAALGPSTPTKASVDRLARCHRAGWPGEVERAWQRLVGRRLDARGMPGTLDGEPAGAFLLRGGEPERARRSLLRRLERHPRDARAWEVLVHFEPLRAAARAAFHGGPVLDAAARLIDAVTDDELRPVGPWLLSYAWFDQAVGLDEIASALDAEGLLGRPPLPAPGDPRAFAWYLLDAGGRPLGGGVGVVEARRRLQRISPVAFARYLGRVEGRRLS